MTIGGFAKRLRKKLELDDTSQKSLEIILSEVQRLEKMVGDIHQHTSLPDPELTLVSLPTIVDKALDVCASEADSAGVRVERRFLEEIPKVLADGELLELALVNIVGNAIQAMPKGGDLDAAVLSERGRVCISVRDTGPGIASEGLPHVFDPFFSSNPQATGLGLTTAQRIISEHNGEIEISSTPGKGTEVRVWLHPARSVVEAS